MTTNPLSRERLAAAGNDIDFHGNTSAQYLEKHGETIRAALSFLLNPEPTVQMVDKGIEAYKKGQSLFKIYAAMTHALTRENDNG